MTTPSHMFNDESRQRINTAVLNAESKTSAEIVPIIASESGRYDRAEDLIGFAFSILALVIAWLLFQRVEAGEASWSGPRLGLNLVAIVLILVGGFIAGTLLASHVHGLRKLATTRAEMQMEVNERARQLFFDHRIHHAPSSTGVLIYISLFERTAVILADDKIVEALGLPAIEEWCDVLTQQMRERDAASALEHTIGKLGQRLSQVLPRAENDRNELPDALITVD